MTTPTAVTSAISALSAAITAASPLAGKSLSALQPTVLAAQALNSALDTAIPASAGTLDGPEPSGTPQAIVTQFLALSDAATLQSGLATMRGYSGRVLLNILQATG